MLNLYLTNPMSVHKAIRQVMAPKARLFLSAIFLSCWRTGRKLPHHKLPDEKASKQRHRQKIDTTMTPKSWSQELPRKRVVGMGVLGIGVERGGQREDTIGQASSGRFLPGKSREPLWRERKESGCIPHRPWGGNGPGEENGWARTTPWPEWEGPCYSNNTQISHKFLRHTLTNIQ